ncbi:cysteine protease [Actinomortierella ambigua]|nr:cysteine protease [Actinomortierella ambigua]
MTEENRDFITLHVFEGQKPQQSSASSTPTGDPTSTTNTVLKQLGYQQSAPSDSLELGQRIYYEGNSLVKGMYVNSPHILVRFEVPPGKHNYTIVLSQHIKLRDLHFTLRAYAMCQFTMKEIPKKYPLEVAYEGAWTEETAGGCSYNAGFYNNPQYLLSVPILPAPQKTTSVLLMLESPKDYAAHIQIVNSNGKRVSSVWTKDIVAQSGEYRHGFCYCEMNELRPGVYTVIVSTFEPGQTGKYKLIVQSIIDLPLTPIPIEGAGMFKNVQKGEWVLGESAIGWQHHQSARYAKNPHFLVPVQEMTTLKVRLQTPEMTNPTPKINVTIFERLDEGVLGREVCSSGPYTSVPQGVATDTMTLLPNQYGYLIVVSTLEPGQAGKFVLYCYSDRALKIEPGGGASTTVSTSTAGGSGHRRSGSGSSPSASTPPPLTPSRFRRHYGSGGNAFSPVP